MNRLKATNSVAFASRDIAPVSGTPQYATDGNPGLSVPATIWPAYAWNMTQDEIAAVITAAGITLDDTDWGQLLKALQTLFPSAGINGSQSFTTHGSFNFTVPASIHRVFAMVWAAGGGGGGSSNSSSAASGAGGGEFRQGWILVNPAEVLPLVVGQGGTGGNSSGGNGTDGGNSTVSRAGPILQIQANGGAHSAGAVGAINNSFGAGGTGGSGGQPPVPGAPGGVTTNLIAITINGLGGGSWGSGNALFGFGTNGILPGTGGSGASGGAFAGGSGADGKIVLAW